MTPDQQAPRPQACPPNCGGGDFNEDEREMLMILELYRRDGLDFLQELRGMFAVGLWDRRKQRLVLARDRLGKKPLFFHVGQGGLAFASELRALVSDPQARSKAGESARTIAQEDGVAAACAALEELLNP